MGDKQDVLRRALATAILLVVALIVWVIGIYCQADGRTAVPIPPRELFTGVTSGLVVLGIAGIWVSFFAERQAVISLKRDIDERFTVLSTIRHAGIKNAWYGDEKDCREELDYQERVKSEIRSARGEIRILGIAARSFLDRHWGFAAKVLDAFLNRGEPEQHKLKVLLLHPMCEQAVSRALRESPERDYWTYKETALWVEVLGSCETLTDWAAKGYAIESYLYKVMPAWFLLFINDVLFAEPYQFGTGGRASGKVPIFEIAKGSRLYEELEGHFDYVWKSAGRYKLDADLLRRLRKPSEQEVAQFDAALTFSRLDLFSEEGIDTRPGSGRNVAKP